MAGPIEAAHGAATGSPWASIVTPGCGGEAVKLGQLEQGRHERTGRGGAVSGGGDRSGEGAGRQVVEDHGAGIGLALAELWGLPVGSQQGRRGQSEALQQGAGIGGQGAGPRRVD